MIEQPLLHPTLETQTPSLFLHITESPVPTTSERQVTSTPFTPTTSSTTTFNTETQDSGRDSSTIDLNLMLLEDFTANHNFGAPQRTDVLNTLKALLIDQMLTRHNLEMGLDEQDNTTFIKRGICVYFNFPLTHSMISTEDIFDETVTLLRNLPGLTRNDNITFTRVTKSGCQPLHEPYHNRHRDTDWPQAFNTPSNWGTIHPFVTVVSLLPTLVHTGRTEMTFGLTPLIFYYSGP